MTNITTKFDFSRPAAETAVHPFDDQFDLISTGVRERVWDLFQELIHGELGAALARPCYGPAKNSDGADDATAVAGRHSLAMERPQRG